MKRSAMGSSKYEFKPENFNRDVEDKKQVMEQFKNDLKDILYKDYYYLEGKMSDKTKREILTKVHLEFIERTGIDG